MEGLEPKDLTEHEQIILQEHGVLYFKSEQLVVINNQVTAGAMKGGDDKINNSFIHKNVPTAVN